MAKASLILVLAFATTVFADDRIDALARAKRLCKKENIKITTTIHIADEHAGCDAVYWPSTDTIEVNLISSYWENPARSQTDSYNRRISSTSHVDHVIRHEIAHAKFYRHVGVTRGLEVKHMQFGIDTTLISNEVGFYATRDNLEFVAETWCGIMDGKKYSDKIMGYYNALWEQP